jgi:PAS domain S-box-containing protein
VGQVKKVKQVTTNHDSKLDFMEVLDALPFYVLLVDEEHHIIHANKAVQNELGLDPAQIIGGYCPKVIHGLDTPFYGCPLEESVKKGESVVIEVYDNQRKQWVNSAVYPTSQFTEDGKRIFLHMVTDITGRKRAEEELRASRERLFTLAAHLETVKEEERKRIARDLHDETSQLVASLSAHLDAAANVIPGTSTKARALLKKSRELSVSILDELHKVIYELHPFLLDDLGLVPAVESLLDNYLKTSGLKVGLRTKGKIRRLSPEKELTLFRVIQEALGNIVRHAKARNVTVGFDFQKANLKVTIIDNGIGFDIEKVTDVNESPRGLGILGMRERTGLINGVMDISSRPGKGTEISIVVPLNKH